MKTFSAATAPESEAVGQQPAQVIKFWLYNTAIPTYITGNPVTYDNLTNGHEAT